MLMVWMIDEFDHERLFTSIRYDDDKYVAVLHTDVDDCAAEVSLENLCAQYDLMRTPQNAWDPPLAEG